MITDVTQYLELFAGNFKELVSNSWTEKDSRLHQAINYCLTGDGKRVRALFAMMVCAAYDKDPALALTGGMAVEMVHAYSLAHDDLPCMDDDDWRRGRPSLHKAFDEATALLAGDAVLTDAMRLFVDEAFNKHAATLSDRQRVDSLRELTLAAGGHGMVYGQDQDMFWTGKGHYSLATLEKIHRGKTGGLIGASCALGAIAAGAGIDEVSRWREFGIFIGLAFQAVDDTLDDESEIGKTQGKDFRQGKLTFLSLYSKDEVLRLASAYTDKALAMIPIDLKTNVIQEYAKDLVFRKK